tara:strand:- start:3318 stop:4154 length:837 start_codon:yes stop_codon:yes gene_type:complete
MKNLKNFGLDLKLEEEHQSDDDWSFGAASLPCLAEMSKEDKDKYRPAGELQETPKGDMMDCASRSVNNIVETKFNYVYSKKIIGEENRKWLEKNGYVQDGKITFSDAFVAINSGTTRRGNSLKAPIEAIRKKGLIPKHLMPLEQWMAWEDYHNPRRITSKLRKLGREFSKRFTINYDKVMVEQFDHVNLKNFIDVGGHAWSVPVDGVYPRTEDPFNHAFVLWHKPNYQAFDNYPNSYDGSFMKNLAPDYAFMPYGYRIFITKENVGSCSFWNRHFSWS